MEYEVSFLSDHSPMFLNLTKVQMTIRVPFRFFNVWIKHNDYHGIVAH